MTDTTTQDFINTKAHQLARKYKNPQMYMDLRQEAVVVAYEMIAQGITDENKISRAMRSKLYSDYNFGQLPVHVPASGYGRKARRDLANGRKNDTKESTLVQAIAALGGEALDEGQIHCDKDHVADYEKADYMKHVLEVVWDCLENREWDVIYSVYLQDVDQQLLADELEISQQRVAQILERSLEKIRIRLEGEKT